MTLTYELFWSFRSPYSYLLTPRLLALEAEYGVTCQVRPVYPLAIRTPEFFEKNDPLWVRYLMTDIFREAAYLDLPFRWPRPDPVQQKNGDYRVPQPHIHRLTHLGVAAAEQGRGLAFLAEVSALIWSGAVDDWHLGDHLGQAAARAGLDLAQLDAQVAGHPDRYAATVEENQVAQRAAGHWGVPMMVFNKEPFFGQDRFDQMKWRMLRAGLEQRTDT